MEEASTLKRPATQDFEARVREHQAGLRAFIRALGADEAWVDDLAQEVFIVAHRRLNDFEQGTDFGKWVRSIARYLVANERRKEARHSRLLPFVLVDALLACETESAVDSSITDLLPAMRDCVELLSPRSRDLLQRRYVENENATTLARSLHMNADAVRQQLLRIRLAVKECVERKVVGLSS
ncbi:MAG: sigma-70 family RNA polymerase sigma factor [Verrucomicrobiota bacterium]